MGAQKAALVVLENVFAPHAVHVRSEETVALAEMRCPPTHASVFAHVSRFVVDAKFTPSVHDLQVRSLVREGATSTSVPRAQVAQLPQVF